MGTGQRGVTSPACATVGARFKARKTAATIEITALRMDPSRVIRRAPFGLLTQQPGGQALVPGPAPPLPRPFSSREGTRRRLLCFPPSRGGGGKRVIGHRAASWFDKLSIR